MLIKNTGCITPTRTCYFVYNYRQWKYFSKNFNGLNLIFVKYDESTRNAGHGDYPPSNSEFGLLSTKLKNSKRELTVYTPFFWSNYSVILSELLMSQCFIENDVIILKISQKYLNESRLKSRFGFVCDTMHLGLNKWITIMLYKFYCLFMCYFPLEFWFLFQIHPG